MFPYLQLLNQALMEGVRQKNRTGVDTFMVPGGMMQFDLRAGFPIVTTKEVNFKAIVAELLGFLRGYDSAEKFRKLGTKIWDANANDNKTWLENPARRGTDDLGRIYGVQWRDWNGSRPEFYVDQLYTLLDTIKRDPTSRRMIVTAWRPDELQMMALPPCHLLWQVLIEQEKKVIHMTMYQRSCDMFLGVPFNISSYALLLSLLARVTGYQPGVLTMFLADVHIYENHLEQVREQLQRFPRGKAKLVIDTGTPPTEVRRQFDWLTHIEPSNIHLEDYNPHPPIKAKMAV